MLLKTNPLNVVTLPLFAITKLLVEDTNRYYLQYMDTLELKQSLLSDKILKFMCLFLAIIAHKGQHRTDSVEDY